MGLQGICEMEKIKANVFDQEFLELTWKWLNDPLIKKLTDTPSFSRIDQVKWYAGLTSRKDYFIWGLTLMNKKIGVFGIKNIHVKKGEYFGFIGDKELWGKGYGQQILDLAVKKATELNLNLIWLKVLKENTLAIRSYVKFGFVEYGQTEKHLLMKKSIC
jgi:RimJ/RimL family protein N-acetyltransferase